jgi:glyoxylase I family protein
MYKKHMISPLSIDHLVFRISNPDQTERFYLSLLGPAAYRDEHVVMYVVGGTRLFFTKVAAGKTAPYDKDEIGLNHIAFAVSNLTELQAIQDQLDSAGITNSGIKIDPQGQKEYVWLNDPDGFRVEFYLRPE